VECAGGAAPGERLVRHFGAFHRLLSILPDDRVQRRVVAIDALKREGDELARRDGFLAHRVGHLPSGGERGIEG